LLQTAATMKSMGRNRSGHACDRALELSSPRVVRRRSKTAMTWASTGKWQRQHQDDDEDKDNATMKLMGRNRSGHARGGLSEFSILRMVRRR
jgi:hypothetical protein